MSVRARIESVFAEVPASSNGGCRLFLMICLCRVRPQLLQPRARRCAPGGRTGLRSFETVDTFPATFAEFVALYTHRQGGP